MKTTKEFPATHSMSTEWFVVDEEGNIALFDFEEEGPIPVDIDESDSFAYIEDIGVPDENGIKSFELTDEQVSEMLIHFEPISEFSREDHCDILVKVNDDAGSINKFLSTFKKYIISCLSHKYNIYLVDGFWDYHAANQKKDEIIELVKKICSSFIWGYFDGDRLSDNSVYPFYCYKQPYNSSYELPERTAIPKHPFKENQIPEENRKKLLRVPVKFSECSAFQIAQYVICKRYFTSVDDDYTCKGRTYARYPKTGGGYCYILQHQDKEKDGAVPITLPAGDREC